MNVLKNLQNDVYCRISCSKIHGVGVVAIRDIPKGKNPFKRVKDDIGIVAIPDKDINNLKPEIKKMIHDFFQKEDDGKWYISSGGLNSMDISFYMNHSKRPNIAIVNGRHNLVEFRTKKKIKAGQELTINYDL
jgi:SET domain-containing protein